MPEILKGKSKFIVWKSGNYPLVPQNIFDTSYNSSGGQADTSSGYTTVAHINDQGNSQTYSANRPDVANPLKALENDRGYFINPKSLIYVPTGTVGFGGSSGGDVVLNPAPSNRTLRLYTLGNSVTDMSNQDGVKEIANSRYYNHVPARHMIPGAPLDFLYSHPDSGFFTDPYGYYPNALANYTWDAISYQPFSNPAVDDANTIDQFMAVAENASPNCKHYIYQRWMVEPNTATVANYTAQFNQTYDIGSFKENNFTSKAFFEYLINLCKTRHPTKTFRMFPVGEVFNALNNSGVDGLTIFDLFVQEGSPRIHLNGLGQYIVSLTFFATLYSENPVGLPVPTRYNANPNLLQLDTVQQTVKDIVLNHSYTGVTNWTAAYTP